MATKTTYRYSQVLDLRGEAASQIQQAANLSLDEYNAEVFALGIQLLDDYFGETVSDKWIAKLYKRLMQNSTSLYWPWFINQRDMWQADFWEEFKGVYSFFLEKDGEAFARKRVLKYWHEDNRQFIKSEVTHDRLRQFILTQIK